MLNEALEKKKQFLKDVQSEQDSRNIPLKHVGISDLRWPLVLRDRQKGEQHTVATVSVAVEPFCAVPAEAGYRQSFRTGRGAG